MVVLLVHNITTTSRTRLSGLALKEAYQVFPFFEVGICVALKGRAQGPVCLNQFVYFFVSGWDGTTVIY